MRAYLRVCTLVYVYMYVHGYFLYNSMCVCSHVLVYTCMALGVNACVSICAFVCWYFHVLLCMHASVRVICILHGFTCEYACERVCTHVQLLYASVRACTYVFDWGLC